MSRPKTLTLITMLGGNLCLTLLFIAMAWQAINEWEALWQQFHQTEQGRTFWIELPVEHGL